MVTVSEAYFDESYDDRSPRVICVAGYVFRKSRSITFGREWERYLKRRGLPYFHANECGPGKGIFKGRTDCDVIERELIRLTRKYSDFGVAVALDQDEYAEICTGSRMFPSAYAYALTNCLYQIAHWRIAQKRSAPTSFFFEQGHKHQGDAHRFLTFMLRSDELPGRIGYCSHGFVQKRTPQVHPGDLLSWLWRMHVYRAITGSDRPVRKDLIALARPADRLIYFDQSKLRGFRDSILTRAGEAQDYIRLVAEQIGLSEHDRETVLAWEPDYRAPSTF